MNRDSPAAEQGLRAALEAGWAAVIGDDVDLDAWRARVGTRDDLDDDDVAAVAFALHAVADLGSIDATLWASTRALDAGYERVHDNSAVTRFQPLDQDTAALDVQEELAWQARVLAVLEGPGPVEAMISTLRS